MTLEQARRFQDVVASADDKYAFETIFDQSTFRARRRSRRKFKLLQRVHPKLRKILRHGEKVRYVTDGRRYSLLASYFGGFATGFLSRRAIVLTNQRIILMQISRRFKPSDMVEQIRYSAVERLKGTLFGNTRIKFTTGEKITLTNVPRADRKFLVRLIELTRAQIPREQYGVESLCSYCYSPVADQPKECPSCYGRFKSPKTAALLSLAYPGIGDWYLGHHAFAAIEIAIASIGWMTLIWSLLYKMSTTSQFLTTCGMFFVLAHGVDALATRHIASMGLYPAEKPKLGAGASLLRFATVIGVFLVALAVSIALKIAAGRAEQEQIDLEQARWANSPAVQQVRAAQAALVEHITVEELARRIATATNDWSVVVLYTTRAPKTELIFPHLVALHREYENRGVDFKIHSADYDDDVANVPPFLARHQAGFKPLRLIRWRDGELGAALEPLGFIVEVTWNVPLVALLDRRGEVIWQAQGVDDLGNLANLLAVRIPRQP